LESDENVRIRLTDSEVQADLAALAVSAANADLIYNKQIAICGMPSGTTKANLLTAATAIATGGLAAASRTMLVAPGVYDATGVLRGGSFAAAAVAAEVAKNSDPTNDLDLWDVPFLSAIEKDGSGMPVFRRRVLAGVAKNISRICFRARLSAPAVPRGRGSGDDSPADALSDQHEL
jgi:hypothetical protein